MMHDAVQPRGVCADVVRAFGDPASEGLVRLNTNEAQFAPAESVVDAVTTSLAHLNLYPNPYGEPLLSSLANYHGVPPECIVVGSGADGILTLCFRAFCDPGAKVGLLAPTYPYLKNLSRIYSCEYIEFNDPLALASSSSGLRMAIAVNPNSPTGRWIEPRLLLSGGMSEHGFLVVDEAYADYAESSAIPDVLQSRNVIVVRTLSKSHGLAGLRVGYAVGGPEIVKHLRSVQDPYPISVGAIAGGRAAVLESEYYARLRAQVIETRESFSRSLQDLQWQVTPSRANFVFAVPPAGVLAENVQSALRSKGFLVRIFESASDGVRISIGTEIQMKRVLEILADLKPSQ